MRLRSFFIGCTAALLIGAGAAQAATSAAIVVDTKTGKVLYSSNADARCFPASLTKMMTLYLLFEALDSGRMSLTSRIKISAHAAAQPPSKLGLKPGSTISARDAILALVTRSANDIAAAIGEHLGGSEGAFAAKMTAKARALGMSNTTFRNASGLPDPGQVTTARDMARLGRALQDRFPKYFAYFATPSFTFQGRKIGNHNHLLGRVAGVNGIKTGYTRASGYNLVTSVDRDGRKLVAVVMGGKTGSSRDQRMASLVTSYLPKATAGPRTAALVVPSNAAVAVADADSTDTGIPVPRSKPDADQTGSVAVAAVEDDNAEGDIDDDAVALPTPAAPAPVAKIAAASAGPDTKSAPVAGWKIQIAATPTEDAALALLDRARSQSPGALGKAKPYTEKVVKDDVTLFRARFAGFADKKSARAACASLTKQKFACIALSD